ncbi:STOM protein, partial [Polyodon spathula]|nr:STOM protein [Polyodon spathula]
MPLPWGENRKQILGPERFRDTFVIHTVDFQFLVIAAEGEVNASRALKEASLVIAESPSALQLRYLQTLTTIASEKNSTIVFPLPIDVLQGFMSKGK